VPGRPAPHTESLRRSPTLVLSRPYSQLPKSWAQAPTFVVLRRALEKTELEFFSPCKGNGVLFGEASVAVMMGGTRGGFQHPVETEIG
jgi:hypothetical protein